MSNNDNTPDLAPHELALLRQTIALSEESKARGRHPFAALVADEHGHIVAQAGNNSMPPEGDPTQHAELMAARAYVYATAAQMRLGEYGNRLDTDGVKLVASTMGKNVADRAMQVLGGYGYVGEYVVERLWRDAKLLEIGGGTNEAHQKNITRDLAKAVFPWS